MNYPTLEITTSIPENGCPVNCVFCPQNVLKKAYGGDRFLTLNNFKTLIESVPRTIRMTFCGFTEPFVNSETTDMILYAYEKEHPISIFTTGIGLTIDDLERIKHIPFDNGPNGGFTLHLPDAQGYAKHAITEKYLEVLNWLKNNRLHSFNLMCMGDIHPDVKHFFSEANNYTMWSRAGNLYKESLLNPYLINYKDLWKSIWFREPRTCGCFEGLQHNVLLPNGDVTLCCMDYGLENIIGNLYKREYYQVVPRLNTCYTICQYCENGVLPA